MFLINDFYISRLQKEELEEMVAFIVAENYWGHQRLALSPAELSEEINDLAKEDLEFFDSSIYYVLRNKKDHKIYGSIKLTYWDKTTILPIQRLFGVSIPCINFLHDRTKVWHIGRFAISHKIPAGRITILKKLLFNAFYPLNRLGDGLLLAECDKKLTSTLESLGVHSLQLGNSLSYLGSETLPICIKSSWLDGFIASNSERYFTRENMDDFTFFQEATYVSEYDEAY